MAYPQLPTRTRNTERIPSEIMEILALAPIALHEKISLTQVHPVAGQKRGFKSDEREQTDGRVSRRGGDTDRSHWPRELAIVAKDTGRPSSEKLLHAIAEMGWSVGR